MKLNIKKMVFVSNYFNHHQKPLCEALYSILGDGFNFIATRKIGQERIKLGYSIETAPYVIEVKSQSLEEESIRLINNADIVLFGAANEKYIKERKKKGKIIFRYSERPLKDGFEPLKYIPRLLKWHRNNPACKPIYMLCASSYTASDYAKFGLFRKKSFKWGYFPECRKYDDISKLADSKEKNSILWCGRFIDFKHPEVAIQVAKKLRDDGYKFTLKMIGTGQLCNEINRMIRADNLEEYVIVLGAMSPQNVRKHMESSEIFLFTSDEKEGWGAVLNEAMNSACAIVSCEAAGSTGFLIENNINGTTYSFADTEALYNSVRSLIDNPSKRRQLGISAYETIIDVWNANVAAERLLYLSDRILAGEKNACPYDKGVCSRAN